MPQIIAIKHVSVMPRRRQPLFDEPRYCGFTRRGKSREPQDARPLVLKACSCRFVDGQRLVVNVCRAPQREGYHSSCTSLVGVSVHQDEGSSLAIILECIECDRSGGGKIAEA